MFVFMYMCVSVCMVEFLLVMDPASLIYIYRLLLKLFPVSPRENLVKKRRNI